MPMRYTYKYYKCKVCGKHKRAWELSECCRKELCPVCIDGEPKKAHSEDQHDR